MREFFGYTHKNFEKRGSFSVIPIKTFLQNKHSVKIGLCIHWRFTFRSSSLQYAYIVAAFISSERESDDEACVG